MLKDFVFQLREVKGNPEMMQRIQNRLSRIMTVPIFDLFASALVMAQTRGLIANVIQFLDTHPAIPYRPSNPFLSALRQLRIVFLPLVVIADFLQIKKKYQKLLTGILNQCLPFVLTLTPDAACFCRCLAVHNP